MRWYIGITTLLLLGAGCVRTPLTVPLPEPLTPPVALERFVNFRNASTKSLAAFLPDEKVGATVVFREYVPLSRVPSVLYDPQIVAEIAYLLCPDQNSKPPELDLPLPMYEKWDEVVPVIQRGWADLVAAAPRANDDCFARSPDPLLYAFDIRGPASSLASLLGKDEVRLVDLEGYGHMETMPKP